MQPADSGEPAGASVANGPRVKDYFLGGKDNYAADRAKAEDLEAAAQEHSRTSIREMVRLNRAFTLAVTTWAVGQGIRQVADLGAGLPADPSVHATARAGGWPVRVAYVDSDPLVLCHLAALCQAPGVAVIGADVSEPEAVLADPGWHAVIDMAEPVLLLFAGILSSVNAEVARSAVAGFASRLAPGSRVAISCITYGDPELGDLMTAMFSTGDGRWLNHSRADIESFFAAGGLEPEEKGQDLVTDLRWWPALEDQHAPAAVLGGVGRIKEGRE